MTASSITRAPKGKISSFCTPTLSRHTPFNSSGMLQASLLKLQQTRMRSPA